MLSSEELKAKEWLLRLKAQEALQELIATTEWRVGTLAKTADVTSSMVSMWKNDPENPPERNKIFMLASVTGDAQLKRIAEQINELRDVPVRQAGAVTEAQLARLRELHYQVQKFVDEFGEILGDDK